MSPRQAVRQISNGLIIIAFFAGLWLACVAKALHWGDAPCPNENRALAAAPDFDATPVADLPKKIEAYVQDHLPFRNEFIAYHAYVVHRCLGLGSDSVLIGKDDFLFYDLGGCQTQDFLGREPFTVGELRRWKYYLERRQAYLAERNCRYLFVIAPNAATVYPEKLPGDLSSRRGKTRREQLLQYLAEQGATTPVLDLTPALCNAKREGQVFYNADSHWNGLGCYAAMQSICQRLHQWFPEVQGKSMQSDFRLENSAEPGGLWWMLGVAVRLPNEPYLVRRRPFAAPLRVGVLPSDWPPVAPGATWTPVLSEKSGPGHRLLVLGDSYMAAGVLPVEERPLRDSFQHALFLGNACSGRILHANLVSIIRQEHPDVVVEEMAERSLKYAPGALQIAPEARNDDNMVLVNYEEIPMPAISVADVIVPVEGTTTRAAFTVKLSVASDSVVKMIYGTDDGTAKAARGDYTPTWGNLSFRPGETAKTIYVPVAGKAVSEGHNKTFIFNLAETINGTIVRAPATANLVGRAPNATIVSKNSVAGQGIADEAFATPLQPTPLQPTLRHSTNK